MSYKSASTSITSVATTQSSQSVSFNYPDGPGTVITGSQVSSESATYKMVTQTGQGRVYTPVTGGAGLEITAIDYLGTANAITGNSVTSSNSNIFVRGNNFSTPMQVYVDDIAISNTVVNSSAIFVSFSSVYSTFAELGSARLFAFDSNNNGAVSPANVVFSQPKTSSIEYLVIAGGGGGGGAVGGGGGAGGYVYSANTAVGANLTITVGAGGAGGFFTATITGKGINGSNSVLSGGNVSVTAVGGGGGGTYNNSFKTGNTGGSGGGGAGLGPLSGSGGNVSGQGSVGGNGAQEEAGGGGGASAAGGNGSGRTGGSGGAGITHFGTVRAGGGGGSGGSFGGSGGAGGGGNGTAGNNSFKAIAGSGTVNTGSGGGGYRGDFNDGTRTGGSGGSGVIIIRYPATFANASVTENVTYTLVDGQRTYQFNSSGTITF